MKTGRKMMICATLFALAITMAVFTLADFTPESATGMEQGFVLGEYEGRLAVFGDMALDEPITVTDIELAGLRQTDRDKISRGIAVTSQEELMLLLEDLGS